MALAFAFTFPSRKIGEFRNPPRMTGQFPKRFPMPDNDHGHLFHIVCPKGYIDDACARVGLAAIEDNLLGFQS